LQEARITRDEELDHDVVAAREPAQFFQGSGQVGILIVRQPATTSEIADMQAEVGNVIKLAVDLERGILAGGGELHADCEQALENRDLALQSPELRQRFEAIVRRLLEDS